MHKWAFAKILCLSPVRGRRALHCVRIEVPPTVMTFAGVASPDHGVAALPGLFVLAGG